MLRVRWGLEVVSLFPFPLCLPSLTLFLKLGYVGILLSLVNLSNYTLKLCLFLLPSESFRFNGFLKGSLQILNLSIPREPSCIGEGNDLAIGIMDSLNFDIPHRKVGILLNFLGFPLPFAFSFALSSFLDSLGICSFSIEASHLTKGDLVSHSIPLELISSHILYFQFYFL